MLCRAKRPDTARLLSTISYFAKPSASKAWWATPRWLNISASGQIERHFAACMWRLRRLYRIEAGIFNFEIVTIEVNNASKEVAKYEIEDWEWQLKASDPVKLTDKRRHDRASTRLDKTQLLA